MEQYDRLIYGFWPSMQLNGRVPDPISKPEQYHGGAVLNLACTQTGLTKSAQAKLLDAWCEALPQLPVSTLLLSSKVSQKLFEAACLNSNIGALSIKWSDIQSLAPIVNLSSLRSLMIGSAPSVSDLTPLAQLSEIEHLFIESVAEPVDLGFVGAMIKMEEFGISAARGRKMKVESLSPLSNLDALQMLWLVSIHVQEGGLEPLYRLRNLVSLRSTLKKDSKEFAELLRNVPTLKHFQPVG